MIYSRNSLRSRKLLTRKRRSSDTQLDGCVAKSSCRTNPAAGESEYQVMAVIQDKLLVTTSAAVHR